MLGLGLELGFDAFRISIWAYNEEDRDVTFIIAQEPTSRYLLLPRVQPAGSSAGGASDVLCRGSDGGGG